jgi:hypothetical protein
MEIKNFDSSFKMSSKTQILNVYKQILRQTKCVQDLKQQKELYNKVVNSMKNEVSSEEEALNKLQKHLSFLRLITPKIPNQKQTKQIFMMKNGDIEEIKQIEKDPNSKAIRFDFFKINNF